MCKFHRVAMLGLVALLLVAVRNPAFAQNANSSDTTGVALMAKDPNGIQGITATDIFKLVDSTLGDEVSSLTMVFNDCFGDSFQTAAGKTTNLKKRDVAIFTATGKTESTYAPGDLNGNAFARGFANAMTTDNTATVGKAFDGGAQGITRLVGDKVDQLADNRPDVKIAKTEPTQTYFGNGKTIIPGGKAKRKMAILFVGNPHYFADWSDLQRQFQALVNAGWKAQDIAIFFGDTPNGNVNGPLVKPGLTVQDDADSKRKEVLFTYTDPADGKQKAMPIWRTATYENLVTQVRRMHAFGGVEGKGSMQLFIWFGGHDTAKIRNRTEEESKTTDEKKATEGKKTATPGGGRSGTATPPPTRRPRLSTGSGGLRMRHHAPSRTVQSPTTRPVEFFGGIELGGGFSNTDFMTIPGFDVTGTGGLVGLNAGFLWSVGATVAIGPRLGWFGSNVNGKTERPPASPNFDYEVLMRNIFYAEALVRFAASATSDPRPVDRVFFNYDYYATASLGVAQVQNQVTGTSGAFRVVDSYTAIGVTASAGLGVPIFQSSSGVTIDLTGQYRVTFVPQVEVNIPGKVGNDFWAQGLSFGLELRY
jgi:hypothetical protein